MSVRSIVPSSAASTRSTTGAGAILRRVARASLWRRCWASVSPSQALEVPVAFPVGNGGLEGVDLHARHIQIVLDYLHAERTAGRLALGEQFLRLAQVRRDVRLVCLVGVTDELLLQGQFVFHTVQTSGDHSRDCQVRVHVPARQPVLDPERTTVPDDTHRAGAVVLAPGYGRRGEGALRVALVRVYIRGEEQRELAQAGELARQEVLEHRGEAVTVDEDGGAVLAAQAQVDVAGVALALVELGHEGDGAAFLGGDLLGAVLVDSMPVRGRQSTIEPEVDLVLPEVALALGVLHRESRRRHRIADASQQRLDACRPQKRVVDVVIVGRFEISISLAPGLLVRVHEDYEL